MIRREGQVKILTDEGVKPEQIINSSENGWEQKVKTICEENKITICFDAICGDVST